MNSRKKLRVLLINNYDELNTNEIFDTSFSMSVGGDLMAPFRALKRVFESSGMLLVTLDQTELSEADAIIFVDYPSNFKKELRLAKCLKKPLYLISLESEIVNSKSHNSWYHSGFRSVFTWHEGLVARDPKKYKKIYYSFSPEMDKFSKTPTSERKFAVMVVGNKRAPLQKGELYSERKSIIDYFHSRPQYEFDLYGHGWDDVPLYISAVSRILNKFKFIGRRFHSIPDCYKGTVRDKIKTLSDYNFAFCYENNEGSSGYITEKLFDAFLAGCIPIYRGEKDILKYIPSDTFIDARRFSTIAELVDWLAHFDSDAVTQMRSNIISFMRSDGVVKFSLEGFSETISDIVQQDLLQCDYVSVEANR